MKALKAEELRGKTPDELRKMLIEARKEQFNMRFQRSQGSLEKTSEIRSVRRFIARIKTFLNQGEQDNAPAKAKKAPAKKAPAKTDTKKTEAKKSEPAKAEKKTTAKKAAPKKSAAKKKDKE